MVPEVEERQAEPLPRWRMVSGDRLNPSAATPFSGKSRPMTYSRGVTGYGIGVLKTAPP